MGYDKPTRGSFAAAVFGGLAQGLSMVAQNKIANRREDELYQKEKADRDAALIENREYNEGVDQDRWNRNQTEQLRREGIAKKEWGRDYMLDKMEGRKAARVKEEDRVQGLKDWEYKTRIDASLNPRGGAAPKQVDLLKEIDSDIKKLENVYPGGDHVFYVDTAKFMRENGLTPEAAIAYVASDDVAETLVDDPYIQKALQNARFGYTDKQISTSDIEPVLMKFGLFSPEEGLEDRDDWTARDVAQYVAHRMAKQSGDLLSVKNAEPETAQILSEIVDEIISSTFVAAPRKSKHDPSLLEKARGGIYDFAQKTQYKNPQSTANFVAQRLGKQETSGYKTLMEILNQNK